MVKKKGQIHLRTVVTKSILLGIIICVILSTIASFFFFMNNAKENYYDEASFRIDQILQRINQNNIEFTELKESVFSEQIVKATTIAEIVSAKPSVMHNLQQLRQLTTSLNLDEIHFFDTQGFMIAGTHPECIGLNFRDGDQIAHFKKLLLDKEGVLTQNMMPNTVSNEMMQYVAVWSENKDFIVQVGISADRLMESLNFTEISQMIDFIRTEKGVEYLVVDKEAGEVLADTSGDLEIDTLLKMSFDPENFKTIGKITLKFDGEWFEVYYEIHDTLLVGVTIPHAILFSEVIPSTFNNFMCLLLICFVIWFIINKKLHTDAIKPIEAIISDINDIEKGNVFIEIKQNQNLEFSNLSRDLNAMVATLSEHNYRIGRIFKNITEKIAVFEYSSKRKSVLFTGKMSEILGIDYEKDDLIEATKFKTLLDTILSSPVEDSEYFYTYKTEEFTKILKIEKYEESDNTWGIIIDKTD